MFESPQAVGLAASGALELDSSRSLTQASVPRELSHGGDVAIAFGSCLSMSHVVSPVVTSQPILSVFPCSDPKGRESSGLRVTLGLSATLSNAL